MAAGSGHKALSRDFFENQSVRFARYCGATMPFFIAVILFDVMLVYHAYKSGRLQPWVYIILMFPFIGGIAYLGVVVVPEWFDGAKQRRRVAEARDPNNRYRILSEELLLTDTIAIRSELAGACYELGRFDEAIHHFDHILAQPLGHEPQYALGKARAQHGQGRPDEALATLDRLRQTWPDFESADGHLLYARALAETGRSDEALEEYEQINELYPGAEATVRHGLLLEQLGRVSDAKARYGELLVRMKRVPQHIRNAQAEWISTAEKRLSV